MVNSNTAINSLPTVQISVRIVAFFEKINDGDPILTNFSVSGEDLPLFQYSVPYYVRTVSLPANDAVFQTSMPCQIIETGFAEQFEAYHSMGSALICLKVSV